MRYLATVVAVLAALCCADASGQTAGLQGGVGLSGGGGGAGLSISAGQGFSRSMTTTAPTVTLSNGVPGSVFGGVVGPFVTGLVPVVGVGSAGGARPVSRIRGLIDRGEIQLRKDSSGAVRLVLPNDSKRLAREPEPPAAEPRSANAFRRALERYAGPNK